MAGDSLARGARSAQFQPAKCSAEKWAKIWEDDPTTDAYKGVIKTSPEKTVDKK